MEEWACSISSPLVGLSREEMWPSNRGRETEIWTIESDHKKHRELWRRGRREGSVWRSVCGPGTSEFVWKRERVLPGPREGWDKVWRKREVCTIKGMFAFAHAGKRATETAFYVERKQANTGMFGALWGDYRVICKYIEQPTQRCTALFKVTLNLSYCEKVLLGSCEPCKEMPICRGDIHRDFFQLRVAIDKRVFC